MKPIEFVQFCLTVVAMSIMVSFTIDKLTAPCPCVEVRK